MGLWFSQKLRVSMALEQGRHGITIFFVTLLPTEGWNMSIAARHLKV